MDHRIAVWRAAPLVLPLLCAVLASPASAQVVEITEGPFVPYTQNGLTPGHGPDPTPFVRIYANVLPSTVGSTPDSSGGGPVATDAAKYGYSALDFVFSVTARVLMTDQDESQRATVNALGELKRANAHVRAEALAADKKTVLASSRQDPALLTLVLSPSEIGYGDTGSASAALSTAISAVGSYFGPVGPLIQTFMNSRQQKPSLAFFAYQSADNEFGWNWYASPNATVEGVHRTGALLQLRKGTAYVRLTVDLVTDWNRFGVWTKSYTFLAALPPPAPAPAPKPKS
jgi:hypothetical protein